MKKSEEHQKRREELKELSRIAREELQHEDLNVNQKIKKLFYRNKKLFTYRQWKENGFSVKKGSKAIALWGKPQRIKQDDSDDEYT